MKYAIVVGDGVEVKGHECFFDCCDVSEVLECIEDMISEVGGLHLYIGENVLQKAEWSGRGIPSGEVVSADMVLEQCYALLGKMGYSKEVLPHTTIINFEE